MYLRGVYEEEGESEGEKSRERQQMSMKMGRGRKIEKRYRETGRASNREND